ncbi:hypothetical protein Tco_0356087 [Tanacetum coccineum]
MYKSLIFRDFMLLHIKFLCVAGLVKGVKACTTVWLISTASMLDLLSFSDACSYHISNGLQHLEVTCSCLNGVDEDLTNLAKVPLLGGSFCACTWHFFGNAESFEADARSNTAAVERDKEVVRFPNSFALHGADRVLPVVAGWEKAKNEVETQCALFLCTWKAYNVSVNEFADWNPDIQDTDSLSSINTDKEHSVKQEDGLSDNGSWIKKNEKSLIFM